MGNKAGFGLYDLWLFSAAVPSGQGVRFTCQNIGAIWDAPEYPRYPHKAGQHYPGAMGLLCPSGTATGPGAVLGHLKCHWIPIIRQLNPTEGTCTYSGNGLIDKIVYGK